MILLIVSGVLAVVFVLLALLVWGSLALFKVRGVGRKIVRLTGLAYLCFLVLFVFCIFPLIASRLIAYSGTRPQDRALTETPGDYGRRFREVEFVSRDAVTLRGWWMDGETGRPAAVLTHGLFRDRREVLERACRLNERGFAALVFDLRKHGFSSGQKVSMGYHERLDVLAACDFAVQQGCSRVVPWAVSMGAVAVLEAVREMRPEVLCVVADSPFLSLEETVARHVQLLFGLPSFPFVDVFVWNFTRINGYASADLDLTRSLREGPEIPVLLIYGEDDQRMPRETAEAVLAAIPSHLKELAFFPGASHGEAWDSDPERYLEVVESFVEAAAVVRQAAFLASH